MEVSEWVQDADYLGWRGKTGRVRIPKLGWLLIGLFALMALALLVRPQDRSGVTRRDFGDQWPFTVEEGQLGCQIIGRPGVNIELRALTFKAGGRTYGLNGIALMQGAEGIDPVLVPNPAVPGSYKSVEPLQDRARALCR